LADVLLDRIFNFVVWANRSGSKSYLGGLITWAKSSFIPKVETVILGGSLEQSQKSYKAMNDFWEATRMRDLYLQDEPSLSKTMWKNGSIAAVLTASQKSVRGPHSQRLLMDEIDEMEEEVYSAALSIPLSKHNVKASTGKLSTNHRIGGVMDTAVQRAVEAGIKIYKWCIWECMESCRDYKCSSCKLSIYCPGKQMKEANGYYKIEDFIQKLYELSHLTLQVEWFCDKVGRDDLVYGAQYDEEINSPLDLPGFDDGKPVYLSVDWGGTNPFSIGVWQKFPKIGWVRVDEYYKSHTTTQRVLKDIKPLPWYKKIREAVADPSGADQINQFKDAGIETYRAKTDVDMGIESTRDAMAPVLGPPKFYVARTCRAWRREVGSYAEKNGKPIDENNHAMDETRYFVMRHIKKAGQVRIRRLT